MEKIKILGEKTIHSGKFLSQKAIQYQDKNGDKQSWEFATRENEGAVGALVEHTQRQSFFFVEQYRIPVQKRVLELVAGICDVPEASKEEIVAQEVREEIGFTTNKIEFLLSSPNSAGLTDEIAHVYISQVSGEPEEQQLGASEEIEVIEVSKEKIFQFLEEKQKSGILVSKAIYSAIVLYLYKQTPLVLEELLAKK